MWNALRNENGDHDRAIIVSTGHSHRTVTLFGEVRTHSMVYSLKGPLYFLTTTLRESWWLMIKYLRTSTLCAVFTLFLWSGTITPSQADTGTLRVIFGKAGLVAAVGSGEGVLTFHGKRYGFLARVGLRSYSRSLDERLHGLLSTSATPRDLAGTYTGVGGGAAVAAGVSGVRLRNQKGVVLDLRGAKLGVEVSANWALITITMKCSPSRCLRIRGHMVVRTSIDLQQTG